MNDPALGAWLRGEREQRGWDRTEMASRLVRAGWDNGDTAVPDALGMKRNLIRWETSGGISPRYRPHLCRALDIDRTQFGPQPEDKQPHDDSASELLNTPDLASLPLPTPLAMIYRGRQEPGLNDCVVEREVLMTAHEGSEQAEHAEQRSIGDTTLDQLRADVARLSREFMTGDPLPLLLEMRRVRMRMHEALDRRMWPHDAATLYFLLGCLNGLMGVAASDLGYPVAAEELYRAGWAYAVAIDHRPLMGRLRMDLADLAFWDGRPREAAQLASSGLEYLRHGPNGIQLHLRYARAIAELGETTEARRSIAEADGAREYDYSDDLTAVGGEYDLSRASERYLTGAVLMGIPEAAGDAVTVLEDATQLYADGPGPDETHGFGMAALARVNLAEARLRTGGIEAAAQALGPVLSLPPGKRVANIPQRLSRVRTELAAPVFQGSPQARDLGEQIEAFSREAVTSGLRSLTG